MRWTEALHICVLDNPCEMMVGQSFAPAPPGIAHWHLLEMCQSA